MSNVQNRIVAIDPAFGGDFCAIKVFENGQGVAWKNIQMPNLRISDIISSAKELAKEVGTKKFIVNCLGLGIGVAENLADDVANYDVLYFTLPMMEFFNSHHA